MFSRVIKGLYENDKSIIDHYLLMEIKRVTFEIDVESYKKFRKKCIDDDRDMTTVLRNLIWTWLDWYPHPSEK